MTRFTRTSAYVPTRAIIDIGSNTVRLVIYGGPARAPDVLHNEKVTARLGKGVAENGKLGARASAAALASLARYRTLLDLKGIRDVEVVATAAARDAVNGPEFLDKIRALGMTPRLLSGEEEAITSAHGVIGAFPQTDGVVADLRRGAGMAPRCRWGRCACPACAQAASARSARRLPSCSSVRIGGPRRDRRSTLWADRCVRSRGMR